MEKNENIENTIYKTIVYLFTSVYNTMADICIVHNGTFVETDVIMMKYTNYKNEIINSVQNQSQELIDLQETILELVDTDEKEVRYLITNKKQKEEQIKRLRGIIDLITQIEYAITNANYSKGILDVVEHASSEIRTILPNARKNVVTIKEDMENKTNEIEMVMRTFNDFKTTSVVLDQDIDNEISELKKEKQKEKEFNEEIKMTNNNKEKVINNIVQKEKISVKL